ncbi:hypothetical protein G5C60_34135 [Streptomyces sp. HC44]|uniref:NACHT domain-containing protein n=1 Tax=Streptomyces scabichelini TaxID=2711217 RepID=A0A6G4VEK4_9ACTN|nr:hypothetical protein [Streptomyces scabichelini]
MTRSALVDALPDAVLALTGADGAEGTGFFVAPGLVLTCAHVIGSADAQVAACWRGQDLTLGVVAEWFLPPGPAGSGPDLALLRAPEGLDHPVVCLAEAMEPGDELWAYGHPQGRYRTGDSVSFTAQGPSRRIRAGGGSLALHHATHGRATPGFSGAPVINWRTGSVCGVLRFAHSLERGVPGARLVPVAELLAAYPFLDLPEKVTRPRRDWLGLLDDGQLRAGGWRFAGPALRAYLRAVRDAADEHPYAIRVPGEATPPLADVYVSQHVSPHGPAGPHAELGDVPWLPAESLLEGHPSVVLVGGPGAGKSSLGRRLTAKFADAWLAGAEPDAVPVRVQAAALTDGGPLSELLRTAVERDPAVRLKAPLSDDFFTMPPMPGVTWLVLVDGVDEVLDSDERQRVLRTVASLWPDPDFRFLVTTRPLPHDELKPLLHRDAPVFRMQPFGLNVLHDFASQWLRTLRRPDPDVLAERFVQATERSHVLHLAGIPLLATMLVVIFAENPLSPLPRGRIELYEQFTDRLLEKMHRRPTLALEGLRARVDGYPDGPEAVNELVKRVRALLEAVASHWQSGGREASAVDLAVRESAALRPGHLPENEWRGVLRELLQRTGLMFGEGDDLVFLHQTVQEFLAARVTARTTDPATDSGRSLLFPGVDEGWEVGDFPEENAYLEFVFGLWSKLGKDSGELVLSLFELPEWRRGGMSRKEQKESPPGKGTGLAARLLHDRGTMPARVVPPVVARLRVAALEHGCAWAAGAIAYVDRSAGIALLEGMVVAPRLAVHQRLAASWELAAWDKDRAVALLKDVVARGMPFKGRDTYWREVRGNSTYTTSLSVGPQVVVSARIEAARTLGLLDHELGEESLTVLASDDSLSLGDRLRAAEAFAELTPGLRTLPFPPLVAGRDPADVRSPETVLEAAKADRKRNPAKLLTEWARDETRFGGERVAAARALVLHDAKPGKAVLEELIHAHGLHWDSDVTLAAEHLLALHRGRAERALAKRITESTFAVGSVVVDMLAALDRKAAAKALRQRIDRNHSFTTVDDAFMLARIDRAAGEKALVALLRNDFFSTNRWDAARALARINPERAVRELKSVIGDKSDRRINDWEQLTAQGVLREIEAARHMPRAIETARAPAD